MAEPVWGLLQKAQDNDETIEEAIARLIDEHLADASAHAETDESLNTHKDQQVIDHPAGSVLIDKFTNTEFLFHTQFESLDGWTTAGSVENAEWPGMSIYSEYPATPHSYANALMGLSVGGFILSTKDHMFQTTLDGDMSTDDYLFRFGFDITPGGSGNGYGFYIDGGDLKTIVQTGASETITDIADVNINNPHIFRAIYSAENDEVKFYVDGILKATTEKPAGTWNYDGNFEYDLTTDATNDGAFRVYELLIGRTI